MSRDSCDMSRDMGRKRSDAERAEAKRAADRTRLKHKRAQHKAVVKAGQRDLFTGPVIDRMSRDSQMSRDTAGLMALPPDWQPDEARAKLFAELLGDIGGANCVAKFRNHHVHVSGEMYTPAGWQAKCENWVRNERGFTGGKPKSATGPPSTSTVWKLEKAVRETLEARRKESG